MSTFDEDEEDSEPIKRPTTGNISTGKSKTPYAG